MLLPTIGAGQKIVLDNASFHRCQLVRQVVEAAGCEWIYLPKYSPDLNPIEHQWHRIKQRVIARQVKVVALRFMATPRKLWATDVGLRPANHITSTWPYRFSHLLYMPTSACLAISVFILDKAPIHHQKHIREWVEAAGHIVLFLPTNSPDLNDIEHNFSALKKLRMYTPPDTIIDEVIRNYCASYCPTLKRNGYIFWCRQRFLQYGANEWCVREWAMMIGSSAMLCPRNKSEW